MRPIFALPFCVLSLMSTAPLRAEPLAFPGGKLILPLTGLELELPKPKGKGRTWQLSSSFALEDAGFDARDVIDEKSGDDLISGTWVSLGYFSAGECTAVLANLELEDAEVGSTKLAGRDWNVRVGRWDFEGDLGKVPMIALCAARPDQKAMLLQHFFLDKARPMPLAIEPMTAATLKHPVIVATTKAWSTDRVAEVKPLTRPEVRNRGTLKAAREVRLEHSNLTVTLPDDGYLWLVRKPDPATPDQVVDWIDRLAPAMPEITLEVVRIPEAQCEGFFGQLEAPRFAGKHASAVPEGWVTGPVLDIEGHPEYTICRDVGADALVVGLYALPETGPTAGSFLPLHALLDAIYRAARGP
jgi:hypothetical protein